METITRSDFIKQLIKEASLPRQDAIFIMETLLSEITTALEDGDSVKISSFGTFTLRDKNGRVGRNPRTGEEADIAPRKVITFRASPVFKQQVEEAFSDR